MAWVAKGGRMVLCYVQGSGRRKRKKGVGCGSGRQENYESERRDCDGSDQNARYVLSRLLQWGTVAEYESEFLMLIKRVTEISECLLKSFYISGLKPLLQCALLRLVPTTLGEAFSIARIMEACFETIVGKKLNIEEKIDIILSWPSEEAPPVIKGSLDAHEDNGVVHVISAIDNVFDIGESNVESIEVRSEFSEFSENKESVKEVVVSGDSQSAYSSYHLEGKVIFKGGRSVTARVAKGEKIVLCYVQGSGRRKRKKGVGYDSGRQENYGSGRQDCGRIRI
nr:retrotransposon Gag protein [Tanacetum cinerariifolium]